MNVTEVTTPENLEDEFSQLMAWYDWANHCNPSSEATWWDDRAIKDKVEGSVTAVADELLEKAELQPEDGR